jgi:hypothetical protein
MTACQGIWIGTSTKSLLVPEQREGSATCPRCTRGGSGDWNLYWNQYIFLPRVVLHIQFYSNGEKYSNHSNLKSKMHLNAIQHEHPVAVVYVGAVRHRYLADASGGVCTPLASIQKSGTAAARLRSTCGGRSSARPPEPYRKFPARAHGSARACQMGWQSKKTLSDQYIY